MKTIIFSLVLVSIPFFSIGQITGGGRQNSEAQTKTVKSRYSRMYYNTYVGSVNYREKTLSTSNIPYEFSNSYPILGMGIGGSFQLYRSKNLLFAGRTELLSFYDFDELDFSLPLGLNAAYALSNNSFVELGYAVAPTFMFDFETYLVKTGPYFRFRSKSFLVSIDYSFGRYEQEYFYTSYNPNTGDFVGYVDLIEVNISTISLGIGFFF